MKIVNVTPKAPAVSVFMLNSGEVYRLVNGSTDILMVTERFESTLGANGMRRGDRLVRSSVSLTTGKIVSWKGHEREHCVVLKATLEVSE
ncbi:hypothetical protein HOT15_gp20 [Dickeya phage Dagda]|uniref:Uncharacterized protein n=2 Tax=Aarhusvirus dagda TaxID=2732762 RepID=A0A2S1GSP6_9CAUD|nr:hypothetical protein HOT15_gp20 [Dickeya phage Dagda]AWD92372.1 hypothetical protein [Dickeya phage Dagda]AXY81624.1 hypothetical protein [Dickeya phage Dagda_B1]